MATFSILYFIDYFLSLKLAFLLPHSPSVDSVFRLLSFEGSSVILWIVVLGVALSWELVTKPSRRLFVTNITKLTLTLACTMTLAGLSVHYILKPLASRPRPFVQMNVEAPVCPRDYSFPSGHAALAFAGMYILSRFDHDRRRRYVYLLLAMVISYSRIYLLCHYLADVVAGGVYGVIVASLGYDLIHRGYSRLRP